MMRSPFSDLGSLSGVPTQTAVDRPCAVYPVNQVSALEFVVPVLPAAGRPMLVPRAVPCVSTCCIAYATPLATSGAMAWLQAGSGLAREAPVESVTLAMATGLQ